ncbi:MAG TPA: M48 family metalloprotease [Vicinamibacteria bacterium]|nr:M48 family metalloprotease [Vicinamibacteria bacterium]
MTAAVLLAALPACATNPATGRRQLSFVSEEQEIQMGRQADQEISAAVGVYRDPDLESYVQRLGATLASHSERPNLQWQFRILDDASVNAMALPGGYNYVTRGLLTYMNSEAELAAVMGHEIGHVTARHTVNQLSKQQLAGVGMVLGMILRPELRNYGNLAEVGMGLLFLKYGRDDEREADALGLRYMTRADYDPRPMADVFTTLGRVSEAEGAQGRVPSWLSTHPAPEDRRQRIAALIQELGVPPGGTVDREEYARRLDGIVFGENPREGYFEQNVFYHPDLRFRFEFPPGWQTNNQKQAVAAMSPEQDGLVVITMAGGASAQSAAQQFFSQQGIQRGQAWQGGAVNGLRAQAYQFAAATQQGQLQGIAAFVELDGKVYQALGYAPAQRWSRHQATVNRALRSFNRVTDRRVLDMQPARLRVVNVPAGMTVSEFARRYPSTASVQTLAAINGVSDPNQPLRDRLAKRVVGGPVERAERATSR